MFLSKAYNGFSSENIPIKTDVHVLLFKLLDSKDISNPGTYFNKSLCFFV